MSDEPFAADKGEEEIIFTLDWGDGGTAGVDKENAKPTGSGMTINAMPLLVSKPLRLVLIGPPVRSTVV